MKEGLTPGEVMEDVDSIMLSDKLQSALYNVLEKIPSEVLLHVHETLGFIEVSRGGGEFTSLKYYNQNLIILADNIKAEDMEDILAHEIAHSFLGHRGDQATIETYRRYEKEADDLIEKWGFNRVNEFS